MSRNRLSTSCQCGMPLEPTECDMASLMTEDEYCALSPSMSRYKGNGGHGWGRIGKALFKYIECPACGAKYAGWYEKLGYSNGWEMVDSSYFMAFNDEPCDADAPTVQGTIHDILKNLKESK